ncbi:helix-hairpin-helix domain-containing protein [Alcanivorax sp.]|uniref:ComEA family DNA-binding protein n=1 Tax=Alcanivorax sp. TaxID=1872427 RepID=UPI0025B92421|nr:helix-hairpin-helix domain-containing protein [Alcanivorax sp.]
MKGFNTVLAVILLAFAGLSQAVEVTPVPSTATASATEQASAQRINLNTADATQLQALKGVGPSTAESIIQWRDANGPFTSVDQLLAVKGIGEKTLAGLRDNLTVQ